MSSGLSASRPSPPSAPSAPAQASEPALFRRHPALRERCPRRPFAELPTAVEALAVGGLPDGALYAKRDDRCCPLYGGNKPRKLEFIVGAAEARGSRRLVTAGGIGTHHGLATAILGRAAGLETTLALLHQPVTAEVKRSLLLFAAYGAELLYGGNVPGVAVQTARALASASLRGERPFFVSTGGSSARGIAGFVSAGLELAEQIEAGALPEPCEIWVPVGTGGTLAGLVAGLRLGGVASKVVGVLVTDILPPSPRRLARAARASLRWLSRLDPTVPALAIGPEDFAIVRDQLGAGYGAPTPSAREAVAEAAASGLALETTYTGKCMAGLLARARANPPERPLLFWNTYNGVDVAAQAPAPLDPAALPPRFRAFLEEAEA